MHSIQFNLPLIHQYFAWPSNKIAAYGVFVGSLIPFATQTITFIGHVIAPSPREPWFQTESYVTETTGSSTTVSPGNNSPCGAWI